MVVEDSTGSLETIVFDKDLQKVADMLFLDQFVLLRVSASKNGGFIAKDIVLPDVPDHSSNRSDVEVYAVFLSDLHKIFIKNYGL